MNGKPVSSNEGLIFGLLGVLCFSLTLPATRLAVATLDPLVVGLGRAAVAACFAAVLLRVTRQVRPDRRQLRSLAVVALGVVAGFPLLSSWAMQRTSASHGAIVLGLMPLMTAIAGALRNGEKPSRAFWAAALFGSTTVIVFACCSAENTGLHPADFALLGAVILCATGYAEGARLARELGGWQVICWALLVSLPFILPPLAVTISRHGLHGSASSWGGFFYLACFSSFLGFFAWYRGLAAGGVAKVSQCQLLQPFLTLTFATLFLGESLHASALLSAVLVGASILISRNSKIHSRRREIPPLPQPASGST
jgi:drug/metabolite transporter (DMT)-like permease